MRYKRKLKQCTWELMKMDFIVIMNNGIMKKCNIIIAESKCFLLLVPYIMYLSAFLAAYLAFDTDLYLLSSVLIQMQ